MATTHDIIDRLPRVIWFGLILAFGLLFLIARLSWLQLVQYAKYDRSGDKQSLRAIRMPATRGRIFDRNGVCLADNRPQYDLVLYLEELQTRSGRRGAKKGKKLTRQLIAEKVNEVSAQIHYTNITVDVDAISNHVEKLMPLPFVVAENLPEDAVARFSARSDEIPAMDLQIASLRTYPLGPLAAHVLGYVGRPEFPPGEEQNLYSYPGYLLDAIGKEGIEAAFDDELRGTAGGRSLTVDVAGYKHTEVATRLSKPGKNVFLTIDSRVQKIVEDAMGDRVGAAVVVDPRNGNILAMCSVPGYDPNVFQPWIGARLYAQMISDPDKPFLNRAISAYEPGSIFKPITMLAGLEDGKITDASTAVCTGSLMIGKRVFRCWDHAGHGVVNYEKAIIDSCDVFFYQYGMAIGMSDIVAMAQQFKLGQRTGVPLEVNKPIQSKRNYELREVEMRGGLPDTQDYHQGDVANTAIGQGKVLATPLQMANVAAALANGGTIWAPRLVDHFESQDPSVPASQRIETLAPQVRGRVNVTPRHMSMVREAMFHVVEDDNGTGHKAYVPGYHIAGKTGTAQFRKKIEETGEERTAYHVWFMTYAPVESPRYAMIIMVEEGDSGGTTCAPIAGQIYRKTFELEKEKGSPQTVQDSGFGVQGSEGAQPNTANGEARTADESHVN